MMMPSQVLVGVARTTPSASTTTSMPNRVSASRPTERGLLSSMNAYSRMPTSWVIRSTADGVRRISATASPSQCLMRSP